MEFGEAALSTCFHFTVLRISGDSTRVIGWQADIFSGLLDNGSLILSQDLFLLLFAITSKKIHS